MGYDLDSTPLGQVPDGTALLLTGPDSSTRRTALDLLAGGEEAVAVVATAADPAATGSALRRAGARLDPGRLALVDATGVGSPEPYVASVPTPADLTAASARLAECFEGFERERYRLGVVSLTDVLGYSGLDPTVRFVGTLRERVASEDGLLLATFDPAVDDGALPALSQGFDETLSV